MTFSLPPLDLTRVLLRNSLAYHMVVVDLQLPLLVGCMQGVLEVARDPLFAELLLDAVDDSHDPFDVSIENVADLQALKRDLTVVFWLSILGENYT